MSFRIRDFKIPDYDAAMSLWKVNESIGPRSADVVTTEGEDASITSALTLITGEGNWRTSWLISVWLNSP